MKQPKQYRIGLLIMLTLCLVMATGVLTASAGDSRSPATEELGESVPSPLQYPRILRVNSTDEVMDGSCDIDHCSLREAVQAAAAGDTITFTMETPATITLGGQEILINKDLFIVGPGADLLSISGGAAINDPLPSQHSRVFSIGSFSGLPVNVSISGLTIRDGRATEGGGLIVYWDSVLTMNDCVIGPNNIVTYAGGGITNYGADVTLERCTVTANEGTGTLGGAGVTTASYGTTTLINSTVSGNITNNFGGGIYVSNAQVNLIHSTVTKNIANQNFMVPGESRGGGAGIYMDSLGQVTLQNSIVAENNDMSDPVTALHPKWPDVFGSVTSLGGNLIGDPTGSSGWTTADLVGTDEDPVYTELGPLQKNDPGRTLTHALLTDSDAINAAACLTEVTLDQRATTRPTTGTACDIGAYEVDAPSTLTILPESIRAGEYGSAYTQHFTVIGTNKSVTWNWTPVGSQLEISCDFNWPYVGGILCYTNPELLLPVDSYTFTVTATEVDVASPLTGSRTYTLIINPLLVFSPQLLPIGRVGQAYNQPITVSGGADPHTITKLSGTLPNGITFNDATDTFTGSPTQSGTFSNIVLKGTDSNGVTKTITYTLTVYPEHLFTWSPTAPISREKASFTSTIDNFDSYIWSYGNEPETDCSIELSSSAKTKDITFTGRGRHKVCLTLRDYNPTYAELTDAQWVTVLNGPPDVYGPYLSMYRSFVGQAVEANVNFYDYDGGASFTCAIDWGDATGSWMGVADVNQGNCTFDSHIYTAPGNYTVSTTVTDDEEAFNSAERLHNVVYLYAEDGDVRMASNSLPTKIDLYGYAPIGTTSMSFNISTAPTHGNLGSPTFVSCQDVFWRDSAECRASVIFTPTITNPLYVGDDLFEFTVTDTSGHTSDPAEQPLWLHQNTKPTATAGTATVSASEPSLVNIFGIDMDAYDYEVDQLTFHIDTPPLNGQLTFEDDPDTNDWFYDGDGYVIGAEWYQQLTYTPKNGTTALTDTFTFHVNDGMEESESVQMTLNLHAPTTLHVNVNDDLVDTEGCDTTHCSLREAVADAEIGDTIDFTLSLPNTITLTSDSGGELLINKNIHILGPGADQLTISAGFMDPESNPWDGFRVFHIFNNYWPMTAEIAGLTIRDGRAGEGGGIYVDEVTTLDMHDCVIGPNNIVSEAGGGISTDYATLNMENVTVVGNHGTGSIGGAGIFVDTSTLTMINSTITGNVTNNYGGGMMAYDRSNVTLIHTTVSGNTANENHLVEPWGGGGGIYIDDATVDLQNSIVAGNTDLTDPATASHPKWPDVYGTFTSLGGNMIGDGTGSSGWQTEPVDLVGTTGDEIDPLFGSLEVHDPGTTPTYSLQPISWAVDAVTCATGVTTDQRGIPRPQGKKCDIGAYELEQILNTAPTFTSSAPTSATQGILYTYTITTTDQDAGDTLTITAPTKPAWLTLTDNGNGTATLSGMPTNAHIGSHPVSLLVTDSQSATATQEFTITVAAPATHSIFLPLIRR